MGWQARVMKRAVELHAREKFQIVHQTTFHTFRVPFLAAGLGIPSVWGPVAGGECVPQGFGRDLGIARFGELGRRLVNHLWLLHPQIRSSLANVGTIFVSNRTTLNFLPAFVHRKCVIVPPNALRTEDEQYPEPQVRPVLNDFRLLYVGNCVATRALPLVFDVLRRPGMSGVKLTVVGDGPALKRWKRVAADLLPMGAVQFAGQITRERLPEFYNQAHALIFPALRDSGGSALLEAMARGVPVMCLDWGGPGEMVDAESGYKIAVRDRAVTVTGLAAAIAELRGSPERGLAMAQAARARVLSLFRWDTRAELLKQTYQRLIPDA